MCLNFCINQPALPKSQPVHPLIIVISNSDNERVIHEAAVVRSHINGSIPFKGTIEKTTEQIPLSPKKITAATKIKE